jgi:hypothetical protein
LVVEFFLLGASHGIRVYPKKVMDQAALRSDRRSQKS